MSELIFFLEIKCFQLTCQRCISVNLAHFLLLNSCLRSVNKISRVLCF